MKKFLVTLFLTTAILVTPVSACYNTVHFDDLLLQGKYAVHCEEINGIVYARARDLFNSGLNYDVDWNPEWKYITITKENEQHDIYSTIPRIYHQGQKTFIEDDTQAPGILKFSAPFIAENLPVKPFIKDGVMYIPVKEVLESIGYTVTFVPDTNSLYISGQAHNPDEFPIRSFKDIEAIYTSDMIKE